MKQNPAAGFVAYAISGLPVAAAPYREGLVLPYVAAGVVIVFCFLFTLTLRRSLFSSRTAGGGWQGIKFFGIAMVKTWLAKHALIHALLGASVAFSAIVAYEYATSGIDYVGLILHGDVATQGSVKAFFESLLGFYGTAASLGVLLGIFMLVLTVPKYTATKS